MEAQTDKITTRLLVFMVLPIVIAFNCLQRNAVRIDDQWEAYFMGERLTVLFFSLIIYSMNTDKQLDTMCYCFMFLCFLEFAGEVVGFNIKGMSFEDVFMAYLLCSIVVLFITFHKMLRW